MVRILKCDVEEFCHGCGLLLQSPRSGYYCFKYSIHKTKPQVGTDSGLPSELPEKLKEYLGISPDATDWPEACRDFTPKAETHYVLRIEDELPSDAMLTVEPLGYSKRIDGYEWYLENNKHIPVEMEQPIEQ